MDNVDGKKASPGTTSRRKVDRVVPTTTHAFDIVEQIQEDRFSFLIHAVSARIAILGNKHFREHDINHYSARILIFLLEQGELRTGEIVELMLLPQSTISNQLEVLHKRRLIRRRRDRQDSRSVILSLTPAGEALARDCDELSLRVQALLFAEHSEVNRQIVVDFLRSAEDRLRMLETEVIFPFRTPESLKELADEFPVAKKKKKDSGEPPRKQVKPRKLG